MYHELVYTTKEYMQCTTAVDGEWLAEMGPMFFSIKESYEQRLARRKRERQEQAQLEKELEEKQTKRQASKEDRGAATGSAPGESQQSSAAAARRQYIATPLSRPSAKKGRSRRGRLGM